MIVCLLNQFNLFFRFNRTKLMHDGLHAIVLMKRVLLLAPLYESRIPGFYLYYRPQVFVGVKKNLLAFAQAITSFSSRNFEILIFFEKFSFFLISWKFGTSSIWRWHYLSYVLSHLYLSSTYAPQGFLWVLLYGIHRNLNNSTILGWWFTKKCGPQSGELSYCFRMATSGEPSTWFPLE